MTEIEFVGGPKDGLKRSTEGRPRGTWNFLIMDRKETGYAPERMHQYTLTQLLKPKRAVYTYHGVVNTLGEQIS